VAGRLEPFFMKPLRLEVARIPFSKQ
jgi:hypothetical protein